MSERGLNWSEMEELIEEALRLTREETERIEAEEAFEDAERLESELGEEWEESEEAEPEGYE